MGFFGREFIDVRARIQPGSTSGDVAISRERLGEWASSNPNGFTLYFSPGRYILTRTLNRYTIWGGDYEFPENCTLWFDEGAMLVYGRARIVIRGALRAPLSRIFLPAPVSTDGPGDPTDVPGDAVYRSTPGMVLIHSDLEAVYPEWWGAAPGRSVENDRAIATAIQVATVLRRPAVTKKTRSNDRGSLRPTYTGITSFPETRPPIPVVFSDTYEVSSPVTLGTTLNYLDLGLLREGESAFAMAFGQRGTVNGILRGRRYGGRGPTSGLRYGGSGSSDGRMPVLHLRESFGAIVESLRVDGGGGADLGVFIEPTRDAVSMHSVLVKHCTVFGCRDAQIQVGPPASIEATRYSPLIRIEDPRDLAGADFDSVVNIQVPVTQVSDASFDVPGLRIESCNIRCGLPDSSTTHPNVGIRLRASNGVANLITGCQFEGHASTFVDAVATLCLVEACVFANRHYERRGVSKVVSDSTGDDLTHAGPLGFEQPEGQDVFLGNDPVVVVNFANAGIIPWSSGRAGQSLAEGAVALHACTSRSLALFGTARPGPLDGKRPERANLILGCVHRPDYNVSARWSYILSSEAPSVSWGRQGYSGYRPHRSASGATPGYNPDPCFTCVGSFLAHGVEVFYGAPQCALVALYPSNIRAREGRPGVRAITYVFQLALAAFIACALGCHRESGAGGLDAARSEMEAGASMDTPGPMDAPEASAREDRETTGHERSLADQPDDLSSQLDASVLDATQGDTGDASVLLFPVIPGTVPLDSYGPPSQQRRACPAVTDGEVGIAAPRLVYPMSPLRMTSRRPTLRWELPPGVPGAQIELCRDPCCTQRISSLQVNGTSIRPSELLPPGVVFWRARGRIGERIGQETSFTWEFGVPHRDSPRDTFKGPIHDFNGDGFDDLVVSYDGYLRVYWGDTDGLIESRYNDHPCVQGTAPRIYVNDIDGDGFSDVISLSDVARTGSGGLTLVDIVKVFHGSPRGLQAHPEEHVVESGRTMGAGDINGDGFVDLTFSRYVVDSFYSPGFLTVLFGGDSGVSSGGQMLLADPERRSRYNPAFGNSSEVADGDGDGYGDVIVGDRTAHQDNGAIYVFRGSRGGASDSPVLRELLQSTDINQGLSGFGVDFAVLGDVNDDQLADVHVMLLGGWMPIYLGSRTSVFRAGPRIANVNRGDSIWVSAAAATDMDGDGRAEVIWGCQRCFDTPVGNGWGLVAGRMVIVGIVDEVAQTTRTLQSPPLVDERPGAGFGHGAVAVDFDGDGQDDLATTDPESTNGHTPRGRVTLFFGGGSLGARYRAFFVTDHARPGRYGAHIWP